MKKKLIPFLNVYHKKPKTADDQLGKQAAVFV